MRYFYPSSRAHHATCMMIDFGMKFKKRNGFWTPEGLLSITGAGGYRIEIAEESLHLLEPVKGDIVFYDNLHGGEAWDEFKCLIEATDERYPYIGTGQTLMLMDSGEHPYRSQLRRIIQRGGKPFHWPEQDEA
jgi:hypothetical protein